MSFGSKPLPDTEYSPATDTDIDPEVLDAALKPGPNGAPTVNIRCRRNSHVDNRAGSSSGDGDLKGLQCKSTTSFDLTGIAGRGLAPGHHLYRCTQCNYSWSVAVGGSFNF